jgi:hypothetical protein
MVDTLFMSHLERQYNTIAQLLPLKKGAKVDDFDRMSKQGEQTRAEAVEAKPGLRWPEQKQR